MKTEKFLHFSVLIGLAAGLSFCNEKKEDNSGKLIAGAALLGSGRSISGTSTSTNTSTSTETDTSVSTLAGPAQGTTTAGDADGTGTYARFNSPVASVSDGTNLYICDYTTNKIRKIVISTGAVTTIAGPAPGSSASGDTEGTGTSARFNSPAGITTDGTSLYISDALNHKIRKYVLATGAVTTLAGPAQGTTAAGDTDGTGNAARFYVPSAITTDGSNLYVADFYNNKIRKIVITTGVVTTLAGPAQGTTTAGDADGTGTAARFNGPRGIDTDGTNLYIADSGSNKIRKIVISSGTVSTFAGPLQGTTTSGDTDGVGSAARFYFPNAIAIDGANLYVSESNNNKIRKIVISTGTVSTFAGPSQGFTLSGDTDGSKTTARFNIPIGISIKSGVMYVPDYGNNKIRKITL